MGVMTKILILHGWAYNLTKWNRLVELLKTGGIEAEVLAIPGLTAKSDEVWDIDNYCNWLDGIINKQTGKVILLGHSNGGKIALSYVLKHPSNIAKLILIDSAGIYHREFKLRLKRVVFNFLAKTGKKITSSDKLRSLLYKFAREKDYKEAPINMRQTMANLVSIDLTDMLNKIDIPTLIVWGSNDKLTPVSDGKLMNNLIKDSKLKIIDGAGHAPIYTHVDEVANIIKNGI